MSRGRHLPIRMVSVTQWQLTNEAVAAPPGAAAALRTLERSSWIGAAGFLAVGATLSAGGFRVWHPLWYMGVGLIVQAVYRVFAAIGARACSNGLGTGSRRIVQAGSSNDADARNAGMFPSAREPFDDAAVPPLRLSFRQPQLSAGAIFVGPVPPWRGVAILHPDGRVIAIGHVRGGPAIRPLLLRWRQRLSARPRW
jgi:hypothetical protein